MTAILHDDWIQTYTGKKFYLMNPTPDMICIEDIAHALSMACRFAGHIRDFYSVAEHSYWVSSLCLPENQLAGLLHDASEAYIADIASPFKPMLTNYKELEYGVMKVIAEKFGFDFPFNDDVIQSDVGMLKAEAKQLLANRPQWAYEDRYNTPNKPDEILPVLYRGMPSKDAEAIFLSAFERLFYGN